MPPTTREERRSLRASPGTRRDLRDGPGAHGEALGQDPGGHGFQPCRVIGRDFTARLKAVPSRLRPIQLRLPAVATSI